MITRIEYQGQGGRLTATVLWVSERRWLVTLRHAGTRYVRHRKAKSLTLAQGMARTWVGR